MKVGHNTIGRWVSRFAVKGADHGEKKPSVSTLRVLDPAQLRQVSGGTLTAASSTQSPRGGW
jgi:transposase